MNNQQTPYSYMEYLSPDLKDYKTYTNFNTPQVMPRRDTSEMILKQTKASLNKFLSNLQKGSTMNNILTDRNVAPLQKTMNNISQISNRNFIEDDPAILESYNRLKPIYDRKNNNANMYNYNKINNFNNNINNTNNYFHPLMNKTYTSFNPTPNNVIKVNKLMDNNQLRKNANNNIYSPSNTDSNINYSQYNTTTKRTKNNNNADIPKNLDKSDKKNMNNKKINIISNKIKKLKDDNIKNKNDLFNLGHIYNEMQKILLQEISRYEKYPKELNDVKKELNDCKNKYTLLLESDKKLSEEKDSKINELMNQINQLKETNKNLELKIKELKELNELMKDKNPDVPSMFGTPQKVQNSHFRTISDKSQKLYNEIEAYKKEIKKITKENQELKNTILLRDITIDKCNEKIKDLEEKLKNLNDIQLIKIDLKEKDTINNKYNNFELLLLDYKKKIDDLTSKNEELSKENKNIKSLYNILKSQKKYLTNENMSHKQLIENLKLNNEQLTKERDNYKIKKEKLINEIEIIKINNDRITNIKASNINNAGKLKSEINLLKKEKEFLGQKNDALQKRIHSLDKKSLRSKNNKSVSYKASINSNNLSVINSSDSKPRPFEHLSIIKSNYFTIFFANKNKNSNSNDTKENNVKSKTEDKNSKNNIDENMKNNKLDDIDKNAKNTVIKIIEKKPDKFTNLSISNKIVDVSIIKKAASTVNKKTKKPVNKFRNLVNVSKAANVCIKSSPKSATKSNTKPIKPKVNNTNKKFLAKSLKASSINNFKIESTKKKEVKKKIVLNKTKTEFFSIDKSIKKNNDIEASKLVEKKDKDKDEIKKSEVLDGKNQSKSKHIDLIVNKNESFTFSAKPKIKSVENKLYEITKHESIYYNNSNSNSVKKELIDNKNVEKNIIDNKEKNKNNSFNIEKCCSFELILKVNQKKVEEEKEVKKEEKKEEKEKEKNKEKLQLQISNISPINFEGKKKSFSEINIMKIASFNYDNITTNIKKEEKNEKSNKILYNIEKTFSIELKFNSEQKKPIHQQYQITNNPPFIYKGAKRTFNIQSFKKGSFNFNYKAINNIKNKKKAIYKPIRKESFMLGKPKKKNLFDINIKTLGGGLFGFMGGGSSEESSNSNNTSNSSKNLARYESTPIQKPKKLIYKIKQNDSFVYKGIIHKKEFNLKNIKKDNSNTLLFTPASYSKKKILYNITSNEQININSKPKPKVLTFNIMKSNSFSLLSSPTKTDSSIPEMPGGMGQGEEIYKKMMEELKKVIKIKDEEIKKHKEEKKDMESMNQLFTDESNRQIEELTKNIKEFKEKNEALIKENESLKEDKDKNKENIENIQKEYESNKNNLNKTIEELSKEIRELKLDLLKKNSELQQLKNKSENNNSNANSSTSSDKKEKHAENKANDTNNNNTSVNNDEKKDNSSTNNNSNSNEVDTLKEEISKLRNSKIIETSQLKLEATKYKVELKRLSIQMEKLKEENNELINKKNEDMDTIKINDIINDNSKTNTNDANVEELKNKNKEYQDQITNLKKEIEEYKTKMKESHGGVDIKKYEDLKKQNAFYYQKIQEAQKKILQANSLIGKAKKYNVAMAYITPLMKHIKTESEKEIIILNKLKECVSEFEKERK